MEELIQQLEKFRECKDRKLKELAANGTTNNHEYWKLHAAESHMQVVLNYYTNPHAQSMVSSSLSFLKEMDALYGFKIFSS